MWPSRLIVRGRGVTRVRKPFWPAVSSKIQMNDQSIWTMHGQCAWRSSLGNAVLMRSDRANDCPRERTSVYWEQLTKPSSLFLSQQPIASEADTEADNSRPAFFVLVEAEWSPRLKKERRIKLKSGKTLDVYFWSPFHLIPALGK